MATMAGVRAMPTIPSCESIHHLATEKNQKGFLSPVGTDDESEDDTEAGARYSGSWHRQLSPCSVLSAASSGRLYAEPAQTLIFLDWDDTIFPCTELFQKRNYSRKTREWQELPLDLDQELEEWRQAAGDFLRAACGISDRCVIVTNSKPPWVTACMEHFAPNLKKILQDRAQNLSIVYASEFMKPQKSTSDVCSERAENLVIKFLQSSLGGCFSDFTSKVVESMRAMRLRCQPRPSFDLTEAKLKAMTTQAEEFYSQYQGQTWKNIISLGDMAYEYDAVKTLSQTRFLCALPRERLRTKSVVLLPSPSLHGLTLQLRIWSQVLPACARFDGDIDIDVSQNFAPFQELARALRLPGLAKLQVPQIYLQPLASPHWNDPDDFMNEEGSQTAANELLDQLPILLHDAFLSCPPKEAFHQVT